MEIEYGVKITTGQTGITDFSLGVVGGVIRWTTGRPDRDLWKQGMITKGSLSPVSQAIEISQGGSYGTMSGFSMAIASQIDGDPTWKRIKDLGLNLIQKEVIFYTFRDGTPTQDWTGVVADTSASEESFKIQCMDAFRSIHKSNLTGLFTPTEFPDASSGTQTENIPVVFGLVKRSALVNVGNTGSKTTLVSIASVNYDVCGAISYNSTTRTVRLKTTGVSFGTNSTDLVGRYLAVVAGGEAQRIKIISNTMTLGGETDIVLQQTLDETPTAFVGWTNTASELIWYFSVIRFTSVFVASNRTIYSIEEDDTGRPSLSYYDEATKQYVEISEVQTDSSLSDISGLGVPGLEVIARALTDDGELDIYDPIEPEEIELVDDSVYVWSGPTTPGDSQPLLFDIDDSTEYVGVGVGVTTPFLTFDVTAPSYVSELDPDDFFLLFNFRHVHTSGTTGNRLLTVEITGTDLYGRTTDKILDEGITISAGPALSDVDFMPGVYFDEDVNPAPFITWKDTFSISTWLEKYKLGIYGPILRLKITSGVGIADDYDFHLKEVGFVGQKSVNLISDALYSTLVGETFGSTWGSRKTAANPIQNIADTVEAIVRVYDGHSEAIDTTSFDLLSHPSTGLRKNWYIGRRLDGNEKPFELCEDLARFGFFGIIPRNNGTRALKAWREGSTVATHNSSSIIQGSIGNRVPSALANLGNDIEVRYAWNPSTSKFDKLLKITKIDEDEFPASDDATWKTYAVGFTDAQYATASALWTLCHASYLKYGLVRALPDEMANGYWFPNVEGDWGLTATNNAALLYLTQLCNWTPFRKDVVTYRLPNTSTHASLELLDKITFNDDFASAGENETGWIVEKSIVPGDGADGRDYIEITLMMEPDTV